MAKKLKKDKAKAKAPKKAKAKKPKKVKLATRMANVQKRIDHLDSEVQKVKALIAEPDNLDDAELEVALAKLEHSLADQIAKMARITGTSPPLA